ncbi:MAG: DUF1186 domain-containing protein [Saprospiraceae bacterium]|nr:DUF1186 domain-containing protein [Saprospiraceae bacterium]
MKDPIKLQLLEYKLTGDPAEADNGLDYSPEISDLINKIHMRIMKNKPHVLQDLQKLIAKYPHLPAFKNYLTKYYMQTGRVEKALEINRKLVQEHPEYVFGVVNLAREHLLREEYDEVEEILGPSLDLKLRYPNRKVFHFSEFAAFMDVATSYLIQVNRLEEAKQRINRLGELKAYQQGREIIEQLEAELYQKELRNMLEGMPDRTRFDGMYAGRSYDRSVQTDVAPVFHHPQMELLYNHEFPTPRHVWDEIRVLPRETLLEDLETALRDCIYRYEYFDDIVEETDGDCDDITSFPLHVVFLMMELNATEKVPVLLEVLRQGEELTDFWFGDHTLSTLWHFIYHLGAQQLDLLKNFVLETDTNYYSKEVVAEAMKQIALHQPERRDEIIRWMREVMQHLLDHQEEELLDKEFITFFVNYVVDIRAEELLPFVKVFCDLDLVDPGVGGDYEELEELMYSAPEEHLAYTVFDNAFDHIKDIAENWGGYLSEEEIDEEISEIHRTKPAFEPPPLPRPREQPAPPATPKALTPKAGRNDPCPCGSGKKYKKCCWGK